MATAPVFEHTEVGGCLSPRMTAFMDSLSRRWDFEDAINAHGRVEDFVGEVIDEVGGAVAFLDTDALDPDAFEELLEPLLAFYEDESKTDDRVDTVKRAREAIDEMRHYAEVLSTLVSNLTAGNDNFDLVRMAVEKLTPQEEQ